MLGTIRTLSSLSPKSLTLLKNHTFQQKYWDPTIKPILDHISGETKLSERITWRSVNRSDSFQKVQRLQD
jgi:hypothetical protein